MKHRDERVRTACSLAGQLQALFQDLTYALLPALIVIAWLVSASPVEGDTTTPCPPPTVGRWYKYKVAPTHRTQALCDDIRSLDGEISDVRLWYESTPNNNPTTTYFDDHPAGLVLAGQPSSASSTEWFYFTWDQLRPLIPVHNKAYVRCQPNPDYPVMLLDYGIDSSWDITFALYVKI